MTNRSPNEAQLERRKKRNNVKVIKCPYVIQSAFFSSKMLQPFIAVIRGVDLNGMDFMRTQPSEVQVVQVKVEHVLGSSTIGQYSQ